MSVGRLLNHDDLDAAFLDNPVIGGHVSMHGDVMNSADLKKFKITADTTTPPGGLIVQKPGIDRRIAALAVVSGRLLCSLFKRNIQECVGELEAGNS